MSRACTTLNLRFVCIDGGHRRLPPDPVARCIILFNCLLPLMLIESQKHNVLYSNCLTCSAHLRILQSFMLSFIRNLRQSPRMISQVNCKPLSTFRYPRPTLGVSLLLRSTNIVCRSQAQQTNSPAVFFFEVTICYIEHNPFWWIIDKLVNRLYPEITHST